MQLSASSQVPDFITATVLLDGSIRKDFRLCQYRGKYVILFSYPMDFTFVCHPGPLCTTSGSISCAS
ncbi:MAG: redoxin domain-containing protein [Gammaproteobacteria bacterium]|nr:redoxin domain-containing protein [Gammaproteobacteria bacterium]MCY4356198.1 redoxin domain-containing protein [Gammaproteobacteria bacterium]